MPLKIKLSTINDENVVLELLGLLTISKDQFYVDLWHFYWKMQALWIGLSNFGMWRQNAQSILSWKDSTQLG